MQRQLSLRKIQTVDKKYFSKWWRDRELLKLTSGILKPITDQEMEKYFLAMLKSKADYHFMIILDHKKIGHAALIKRKNNWYENQIAIGEKKFWDKGYGTAAIKLLIKKIKRLGIFKIYLEVRDTNTRAIRAYEKCGFQEVSRKKYFKNKYLKETIKMELKR